MIFVKKLAKITYITLAHPPYYIIHEAAYGHVFGRVQEPYLDPLLHSLAFSRDLKPLISPYILIYIPTNLLLI